MKHKITRFNTTSLDDYPNDPYQRMREHLEKESDDSWILVSTVYHAGIGWSRPTFEFFWRERLENEKNK